MAKNLVSQFIADATALSICQKLCRNEYKTSFGSSLTLAFRYRFSDFDHATVVRCSGPG
jgi:hypothetical protein